MWKVCVAICVHPLITYGFHCADFGENQSLSEYLWVPSVPNYN